MVRGDLDWDLESLKRGGKPELVPGGGIGDFGELFCCGEPTVCIFASVLTLVCRTSLSRETLWGVCCLRRTWDPVVPELGGKWPEW